MSRSWVLRIFSSKAVYPEVRRFQNISELAAFLRIASLDDISLMVIYPEGDKRDVCMPILR